MADQIYLYLGSVFTLIWGIAHLFPTRAVVNNFGGITGDNRQIITMEWIIEGVFLIFLGVLVAGVTYIDHSSLVSRYIYLSSGVVLIVLAVISLFTGFKVNFLPYRLCPFIFSLSAILIFIGALL